MLEHVEADAGDLLAPERAHQRRLVHDRATGGVDEKRSLLHQAELARTNVVTCGSVERLVQRDEVGFAQQLVEWRKGETCFALLGFGLPSRGPIEHAHAKSVGTAGDRLAYQPASADEADGLAPHERTE